MALEDSNASVRFAAVRALARIATHDKNSKGATLGWLNRIRSQAKNPFVKYEAQRLYNLIRQRGKPKDLRIWKWEEEVEKETSQGKSSSGKNLIEMLKRAIASKR